MSPEHAKELEQVIAKYVKPRNVRMYLEVGARNGISVDAIGRAMTDNGQMVVVDLPNGLWGTDSEQSLKVVANNLRSSKHHTIDLIFGDSRSPQTVKRVRELAAPWDRPFDLVFIDADHTYEAVSDDWKNYGPMGKVVVFDDIAQPDGTRKVFKKVHGGGEARFGVARLWEELKQEKHRWTTSEIIEPESKSGKGVLIWEGA